MCEETSWKLVKHTELKYEQDEETGLLRLTKGLTVTVREEKGAILKFVFKKGLVWDGLSIPKAFRWFLPNTSASCPIYDIAGLVHDFCYGSGCVSKEKADDIFRSLLRDSGVSRWKAGLSEKCVNWFAKRHYGVKNDRYGIRLNGQCIALQSNIIQG